MVSTGKWKGRVVSMEDWNERVVSMGEWGKGRKSGVSGGMERRRSRWRNGKEEVSMEEWEIRVV